MITREQFEARVRAAAKKRYDMRWNEYLHLQNAYIAARMEHEWPLVEAAQAVVDRWDSPLWKDVPHTGEFIGRLRARLTKAAQP